MLNCHSCGNVGTNFYCFECMNEWYVYLINVSMCTLCCVVIERSLIFYVILIFTFSFVFVLNKNIVLN